MGQTMPVSGMNPWVPAQYPFGPNGPDLTPCYWKTEMEELKKMGLPPGSPVAPPPITEEEAKALKKKFLEEQQQRINASSGFQSRNRADPGRVLLPTSPVFERPTSTSTDLALSAVAEEVRSVPTPSAGKVKISDTLGQILLVLIGLLAGFFLLTKTLKIVKRLNWRWTSLIFPKGDTLCASQSTGDPATMHLHGSCPWTCP